MPIIRPQHDVSYVVVLSACVPSPGDGRASGVRWMASLHDIEEFDKFGEPVGQIVEADTVLAALNQLGANLATSLAPPREQPDHVHPDHGAAERDVHAGLSPHSHSADRGPSRHPLELISPKED